MIKNSVVNFSFTLFVIFFSHICIAKDITYSPSNASFPNPERGWYAYSLLLENNSYSDLADRGFRLTYAAVVLKDFMDKDIDEKTLEKIKDRFQEMRNAGIKAVLRVNYNEVDGGSNPDFPQIERHMQQLFPILNANKDIIAFIESGYMGPWGEWHFYEVKNPPFPDSKKSWKKLIDLLLSNTPNDRFLMIRYPGKKQEVFEGNFITEENAFSNTGIARIGHHNDCFVSSLDDVGTYQTGHSSYSQTISDLKNYLKEDTRFSPMGGETCAQHRRSECKTTLFEMENFHWTYLNQDYHPLVLNKWKDEGCYEEIDKRLGYRLSLVNATLPDVIIGGSSNTISLTIKNSGFARPWYYRTPYIRLIKKDKIIAEIKLDELDIRSIEANKTQTFLINFDVPENINGKVDVALWLPDENPKNHSNARFSIRLANKDIWNPTHGHNILTTNIDTNLIAVQKQKTLSINY